MIGTEVSGVLLKESSNEDESRVVENLNKVSQILLQTVPCLLLLFGIPGNVISIVVLNTPHLKDKLYSVFLVSLCVFNILILLFSLPRLFMKGMLNREIFFDSPPLCVLVKYGTQTLIAVSHWHLVLLCTWRLLYYKDRTRAILKYFHPTYIILFMVVLWSLVYVPLIYYWISFKDHKGQTVECYLPNSSPLLLAVIIMQAVIPCALLMVVNMISYFVHRQDANTGLLSRETANKVSQSLLVIILGSCLQFFVTVFPVVVVVLGHQFMFDHETHIGQAKCKLAHTIAFLILYSNAATNFLIYCAFGKIFRREFYKMMCSRCAPAQPQKTVSGISQASDLSKAERSVKYLFSDSYFYSAQKMPNMSSSEISELQFSDDPDHYYA